MTVLLFESIFAMGGPVEPSVPPPKRRDGYISHDSSASVVQTKELEDSWGIVN